MELSTIWIVGGMLVIAIAGLLILDPVPRAGRSGLGEHELDDPAQFGGSRRRPVARLIIA